MQKMSGVEFRSQLKSKWTFFVAHVQNHEADRKKSKCFITCSFQRKVDINGKTQCQSAHMKTYFMISKLFRKIQGNYIPHTSSIFNHTLTCYIVHAGPKKHIGVWIGKAK